MVMNKKKVVVGMSGGVDSSVAAYLLKEEGFDVVGVTMQIWQDEDEERQQSNGGCCGLSAVDDARRVAAALDIPYYVMNFKNEFKSSVIDYFIEEYKKGRTPNPCIACNRYVKWESLLHRSLSIGADYIATGHYAKVVLLDNGRYTLKTAKSSHKDQTYALYNLTQEQLARTLMPVGDYEKDEIRKIAENISLRIAKKPDSQDICFVPDGDYAKFIEENSDISIRSGEFVNSKGEVLGTHKGITHYTVGQRKGLGLSLGEPAFVTKIDVNNNKVIIGNSQEVLDRGLIADRVNWMSIEGLRVGESVNLRAKIRYSHKGENCVVKAISDDKILVEFENPVRAVTPGQAVVFYDTNSYVAGGASIVEAIK